MFFDSRSFHIPIQSPIIVKETVTPGIFRMQGTEHEEFILIAEFHEQLGPDPLWTIPNTPEGTSKLDQNSFAIHLLSKNLQSSTGGFKIANESQSVFRYTFQKFNTSVFAYYFALCDIQARGYIRQFCMVYVAEDYDKIMENFQMLSAYFAEVAAGLCYGNLVVFRKDIVHHVEDLKYSLEAVLAPTSEEDRAVKGSAPLHETDSTSIRDQMREMEKIKRIVDQELTNDRFSKAQTILSQQSVGSKMETKSVTSVVHRDSPYTPRRALRMDTYRFQRKLRDLEHMCNPTLHEHCVNRLTLLQRTFSQFSFVIAMEEAEKPLLHWSPSLLLIGNTPVMNFARKEVTCSSTSESCEQCGRLSGEAFATPRGGSSATSFSESGDEYLVYSVLNSSSSLPERKTSAADVTSGGISQREESREAAVVPDERQVENTTLRQHHSHFKEGTAVDNRKATTAPDSLPKTANERTGLPHPKDEERLQKLGSVLEKDPALVGVSPPSHPPDVPATVSSPSGAETLPGESSVGQVFQESTDGSVSFRLSSTERAPTTTSQQSHTNVSPPSLPAHKGHPRHLPFPSQQPMEVFNTFSPVSPVAPSIVGPSINGQFQLVSTVYSPSSTSSGVLGYDRHSSEAMTSYEDTTYPFTSFRRKSRQLYVNQVFPEPLFDKKQSIGIVHFCRYHVAVKDIIFALLHGRHFVIIGTSKTHVKRFIRVLSLFVPGRGGGVLPWLEGPSGLGGEGSKTGGGAAHLTTQHLLSYRLIGMSTRATMPKQLQNFVSYWDIDTGKLQTPPYNGKLLSVIASRNKSYRKDDDFVAKMHCVFLEMGMLAFMYYRALMEDRCRESGERKFSNNVLKSHAPHDQAIIKCLSDQVVSQQLAEYELVEKPPTMKLTFKQNKRFECKAKPPPD